MADNHALTTAEVAIRAGIHKDTLLRWLRAGLVPEPQRDRHGWRCFTSEQAAAIEHFAKVEEPQVPPHHNQLSTEIERLKGVDWNFRDAKTGYLTHGLHPYPAKYIPQIPNAIIQELSATGETVGDIFCGSGTTLVEALLLKRHAVGIDANPLAALITKAKTTPLDEHQLEALTDLGARAEVLAQELALYEENSLFEQPLFRSEGWRPSEADIGYWFFDFVIEELSEIRLWCSQLSDEAARNAAFVALSAIIVAVSHQDSDTRYVRREKTIRPGDTMRRFARALRDAIRAIAELSDVCEKRFSCTVVAADLLAAPEIPPLDLVVCSPPYPNAYSYHLYHRTRMLWLGMNQGEFKRAEIGSHRKYSAKGKRAASAETFKEEMSKIFDWLTRHLKKGRHACFVLGDSTIAGERIDNCQLLIEAAKPHGFTYETSISRDMHSGKKSFNPAIGKIKTETLLVLRHGPTPR